MNKIGKYLKEVDTTPVLKAVFMFSMLCIVLVFIFSVINGVRQILGIESSEKIISAVSSLATALTLAFLVYQHRENNSQNYQLTIAEEAKLVIDKMVLNIDGFNSWNNGDVSRLSIFLSRMSNHAADLEILFDKINDVALKQVILIRWQDMYFNHYESAVHSINVIEMIKNNLDMMDPACASAINRIVMNTSINLRSDAKNYKYYKKFIDSIEEEGYFDFSQSIGNQISFQLYFLDKKNMEKYLANTMNIIEPKNQYPSLYAIVEASR